MVLTLTLKKMLASPPYSWLLLSLMLCANVFSVTSQQATDSSIAYSSPTECLEGVEFFSSSSLLCVPCATGSEPTEDGLHCQCLPSHYREVGASGSEFECLPCPNNTVSSRDGLFCLNCSQTLALSDCSTACPSPTQIYVDALPELQSQVGERSCEPCPEGLWAGPSGFDCVECGAPSCEPCVASSAGLCFTDQDQLLTPPPGAHPFYAEQFSAAAVRCQEGNDSACQLVANLCVLEQYDRADPACSFSLSSSPPPPPLPPPFGLYFPVGGADELLAATDLTTRLFTRPPSEDGVTELPLVVVSYSLAGRLLGVKELSKELLLCRDQRSPPPFLRPGLHYSTQCTVPVSELLGIGSDQLIFYDIYLRDGRGNASRLRPLPVLVEGYTNPAGVEVNREGSDPQQWQLTRRLFLAESLTSDPQYAQRIELSVEIRLQTRGLIFSPFLRVAYGSWNPASNGSVPARFSTLYHQNASGFHIGLAVCVSVLAVLAAVYTGLRVNGFIRRTGGLCCDLQTFLYMAAEFSGSVSTLTFILLTITALFWLLFFKGQHALILALPVASQDLGFEVLLGLALIFRVVHVAYLIWQQCTVDVFLIDWERPKGTVVLTNQNTDESTAPPTSSAPAPVSIWRTYFVANEWNELQTVRKVPPYILLILALLLLQVVGLGGLGERDPRAGLAPLGRGGAPPYSPILRFAVTSFIFLFLGLLLRFYMIAVYERFFEHKIRQFVDFCSVSNVSVFILSHRLFGHYIHGRSVHGHADTDMKTMNKNLQKEQEDMCGRRGLLADSDDQTFEMALSGNFRSHYDRILVPLLAERAEAQPHSTTASQPRAAASSSRRGGVSETTIRAYEEMNRFLSSFIERSLHDVDYVVKNKVFAEWVLEMEFYDPVERSLFYKDGGFSFDRVLHYGSEWSLFQLELLVFAVTDLAAESFVLAAVLFFLVSWGLSVLRDALGRRSLARKTLVDDRFLI